MDNLTRLTLKFSNKKNWKQKHASTQHLQNRHKNTLPVFYSHVHLPDPLFMREQSIATHQQRGRTKFKMPNWRIARFDSLIPLKSANKRKAVILDFFNGVSLWAQYAEDMYAINEWEISSEDYRIEKAGSEYRIYFETPRSQQILPTECENCIETTGISISIQNPFDREKIRFKLNINDNFPRPFPIFESWTKFNEDEYFE